MDELLIRVMTRLVRVYDELGEDSFERAANRALVTIARSVQLDAERKAASWNQLWATGSFASR